MLSSPRKPSARPLRGPYRHHAHTRQRLAHNPPVRFAPSITRLCQPHLPNHTTCRHAHQSMCPVWNSNQQSSPSINLEILPPTNPMSFPTHHLEKNCGYSAKSAAQHLNPNPPSSPDTILDDNVVSKTSDCGSTMIESYDRASVRRDYRGPGNRAGPSLTGGSRNSWPPIPVFSNS